MAHRDEDSADSAGGRRSGRHLMPGFAAAGRGVAAFLGRERNARWHALATAAVVLLAYALALPALEWAVLVLAVGLVWTAEALNTAVERALDAVHPEHDPRVGLAKDIAAGAVLLASGTAIVVGLLLIGPPCWRWAAASMIGS